MSIRAATLITLTILAACLALIAAHTAQAAPDAPLSVYLTERVNATIIADTYSTYLSAWNITGNLTVANLAGEPVYDVYVAVYQNSTLIPAGSSAYPWATVEKPSYLSRVYAYIQGVNDTGLPGYVLDKVPAQTGYTYIIFHIPVLQPGDRVVLKYVLTDLKGLRFPLKIGETVKPDKILDLVQTDIYVNITVRNTLGTSIYVKFRKTLPPDNGASDGWNNTAGNPVFTAAGTASTGVAAVAAGNPKLWYWTGNGAWPGTWIPLAAGSTASVTNLEVTGTANVSEVGGVTTRIGMGVLEAFINVSRPLTGTELGRVQAVAQSSIAAEKTQEPTAPSTEWNETLVFCDRSGVFSVELYNTTLWATEAANPSSTPITGSVNTQYSAPTPLATLLPGQCYTYGPFEFTATVVPWVWASAAAGIVKSETGGWWLYNLTLSGDSSGKSQLQLLESVWAVKGYLIKVVKEVRNATDGVNVTITLYNIGGSTSPYVSMYDLVPQGFQLTAVEASMGFNPYAALTVDNGAPGATPPDFSQKVTNPLEGYQAGYVWDIYPVPAPEMGFNVWLNASTAKTVQVRLSDGSTRTWTVQGVDGGSVLINGTTYNEGDTFTVGVGTPYETNFTVAWVEDSIDASHNGHVLVSAKTYYPAAGRYVYNPVAVHYHAPGTGNYNASKVFIVGVDPRHTLDAVTVFQPNTSIAAYVSTSEPLLALAALGLLAAGFLAPQRRAEEKEDEW